MSDELSSESISEPPIQGNFALPTAQQPGPFLAFGQSLIDKNQVQLYISSTIFRNESQTLKTITPNLVFGLSDQASILISTPIAVNYANETSHSHGLGDAYFQGEYAIYDKANANYADQLTVVGGLTLPTGSFEKEPSTGIGSNSYFFGTTFNRMSVDWLGFASSGLNWITKHDNFKQGNQFLYQLGLGRNIKSEPGKYIFSGLIELLGTYSEKDRLRSEIDPDSGGNLVVVTPSLWFSTPKMFYQLGL